MSWNYWPPKGADYSDLPDLWSKNLPLAVIAEQKGVSVPMVSQMARKLGLAPKGGPRSKHTQKRTAAN